MSDSISSLTDALVWVADHNPLYLTFYGTFEMAILVMLAAFIGLLVTASSRNGKLIAGFAIGFVLSGLIAVSLTYELVYDVESHYSMSPDHTPLLAISVYASAGLLLLALGASFISAILSTRFMVVKLLRVVSCMLLMSLALTFGAESIGYYYGIGSFTYDCAQTVNNYLWLTDFALMVVVAGLLLIVAVLLTIVRFKSRRVKQVSSTSEISSVRPGAFGVVRG